MAAPRRPRRTESRHVVAAVYGKPPASQRAQVLLDALKATISEPEWPS